MSDIDGYVSEEKVTWMYKVTEKRCNPTDMQFCLDQFWNIFNPFVFIFAVLRDLQSLCVSQ